jgi:DNA-binding transcriptional MocR family regulator
MRPILFTRGVPATESFPSAEMAEAAAAVLGERGPTLLQYGPSAGLPVLREWLAEWQGSRPEEVLAGNGSLQLFDLLCLVTLRPGDVVVTEAPTYDRTLTLLRRHGAQTVGVPLEPDGPDLEALEATVRRRPPRLVYMIPDFQNPSGATCSGDKRRRIAELARELGFLLVEDSPYRLLRYRGREEPTLRSLAPEVTIHMSSFSKLIGPGPRLGFMVGPVDLLAQVARALEDTYISPSNLAHGIAWEWCRRGLLPGQIERLKALYAPRLEACLEALERHLPAARATRPDGGFFVSLTLPPGVETTAVRRAALARELQLTDGHAFFPEGGGERFLRLPYCALAPEDIREGIGRLSEAVREVQAVGAPAPSR